MPKAIVKTRTATLTLREDQCMETLELDLGIQGQTLWSAVALSIEEATPMIQSWLETGEISKQDFDWIGQGSYPEDDDDYGCR